MESDLGSHSVWPTIPRVKEVYEQVDWDASEYGKIRAVTREGNGKVCREGHNRPWFPDSTNSQVSDLPDRFSASILGPSLSLGAGLGISLRPRPCDVRLQIVGSCHIGHWQPDIHTPHYVRR